MYLKNAKKVLQDPINFENGKNGRRNRQIIFENGQNECRQGQMKKIMAKMGHDRPD